MSLARVDTARTAEVPEIRLWQKSGRLNACPTKLHKLLKLKVTQAVSPAFLGFARLLPQAPKSAQSGSRGAVILVEAEHAVELSNAEAFADLAARPRDDEFPASLHNEVETGDTSADARAVDVRQPGKVEEKLPDPAIQRPLHHGLEFRALRAKQQTSGKCNYRQTVGFGVRYRELHPGCDSILAR